MSDPSVTPALAAHREALAVRLAALLGGEHRVPVYAHDGRRIGWTTTYVTGPTAETLAAAILADPARGLTVETGAVDLTDNAGPWQHLDETPCPHYYASKPYPTQDSRYWWCTEHQKYVMPAHGLVRDEPSEGERRANPLASLLIDWECDGCGKEVQVALGDNDGIPLGWVEHNMDDGDADDDALCDDCAHARTDVVDQIVHKWERGRTTAEQAMAAIAMTYTAHGLASLLNDHAPARSDDDLSAELAEALASADLLDYADRRILAARLRHDDGEADRGR